MKIIMNKKPGRVLLICIIVLAIICPLHIYHDKKKVLMVGDSLTSDIQGGINAGIDTCWYNPNEYINNTNIKPTYEIKSLFQLRELLK